MAGIELGVPEDQDSVSLSQQCVQSKLYQALHPFIILLKASGLFYTRQDTSQDKGQCKGISVTVSHLFTTLILALHWANFLRYISSLRVNETLDTALALKVLFILATLMCAISATCLYVGCFRADLIPQLFVSLSTINSLTDAKYLKTLRFRSTVYSIGYCVLFITMYVSSGNQLLSNAYAPKYAPLKPTNQFYFTFRVVVLIFEFFYLSAWILPLVLLCLLCVLLANEFHDINKEFEEVVKDSSLLEARIGTIRQRHVKACGLVERADLFLSPLIAITFVTSITGLCLMAYLIFIDKDFKDSLFLISFIIWTAMSACCLGVSCIFTAYVNSKVS